MSGRPLALVIGSSDGPRLHAALSLAAAAAALGRPVALYFHGEAVAALAVDSRFVGDERLAATGMPTVADLVDTVLALGVGITACQSGLALTGLEAKRLMAGVDAGGLVEFLGRHSDWELLLQ